MIAFIHLYKMHMCELYIHVHKLCVKKLNKKCYKKGKKKTIYSLAFFIRHFYWLRELKCYFSFGKKDKNNSRSENFSK